MDLSRKLEDEQLTISDTFGRSFHDAVNDLERELGVQPGFLEKARHEDDWSFIIKTHALIEAALSYLLMHEVNRPELGKPLSKMNYKVKMQFIEALALLKDEDRRFLYAINELRNHVIHDVRNVSFDLKAYFASLDRGQLQSAIKQFNSFAPAEAEIDVPGGGKQLIEALFKSVPKRAIWWSSMVTVGVIYGNKKTIELRNKMRSMTIGAAALRGLQQLTEAPPLVIRELMRDTDDPEKGNKS